MCARQQQSHAADAIPLEFFEQQTFLVRGHKVMLDSDLATLYGVLTKNLNKAVKRNLDSGAEYKVDFDVDGNLVRDA